MKDAGNRLLTRAVQNTTVRKDTGNRLLTRAVQNTTVRDCTKARPVLLMLTLLACCFPAIAEQSNDSRAAEIQSDLTKAAEYLHRNDAESAAKEFEAVLKMDPRNAEALANLGVIAFFGRDYRTASEYLKKALDVDPSLVKTEALLGICQRRLGQPSAQALLEKSFPQLKDKNLAIQAGLELENIYYQQGNLDGAASVTRSLIDLDPDNTEILYMGQRVYSELADDTLNKLAILAPDSARMQQVIAERLVNAGDLKGAIMHYRKCLEMNPRVPGVRFELAEAIFESAPGDSTAQLEAQQQLQDTVKLEGDSAKVECELAKIALRQADTESSNRHYARAYALNPHDVDAELGMAHTLMAAEQDRGAIPYLQSAIESDPLNSEAHYRLARAYKTVGRDAEAAREMRLFQEIKQTKAQVRELYRQMNKHSSFVEDQISEVP